MSDDAWYADGVAWGALNGLVNGYSDGTFGPNNNISRQEIAVILYRFAQKLGIDVTTNSAMPEFTDSGDMDSWAAEAMAWACQTGIITGRDNQLAPKDGASRIEAAAMRVRFLKMVENNQNPTA